MLSRNRFLKCQKYQPKDHKCQHRQYVNWCRLQKVQKKRGVHVYHLNIGQPDIKTPKVALDAVKNNTIDVLAYSRSEGSETYRTKLAAYYQKNSIPAVAEDIIVTTGGSESTLVHFWKYYG